MDRETLCQLAEDGETEGEAELGLIFDADDVASVEIICECCRGLGHIKSRCPSNRNRYRSLSYAVGILQSKLDSIKDNPSRRQPPRGQRQPFRAQPRRFQPRQSSWSLTARAKPRWPRRRGHARPESQCECCYALPVAR